MAQAFRNKTAQLVFMPGQTIFQKGQGGGFIDGHQCLDETSALLQPGGHDTVRGPFFAGSHEPGDEAVSQEGLIAGQNKKRPLQLPQGRDDSSDRPYAGCLVHDDGHIQMDGLGVPTGDEYRVTVAGEQSGRALQQSLAFMNESGFVPAQTGGFASGQNQSGQARSGGMLAVGDGRVAGFHRQDVTASPGRAQRP